MGYIINTSRVACQYLAMPISDTMVLNPKDYTHGVPLTDFDSDLLDSMSNSWQPSMSTCYIVA